VTGKAILFCRERFTAELDWAAIGPLLPGWTISTCPPGDVAAHVADADVICPFGARIDATVLEAGTFGLVHQYGVGLEKVDVARATDLGVLVARVPGDAGGNAESVAELAVLHLLALTRRLDDLRATMAEASWESRPTGGVLLGATVAIVGLGAIGSALAHRLACFGTDLLAVRAHPERGGHPAIREIVGPDRLPEVLSQSDAVVCCAMFDPGAGPIFDADAFAAMKRGAIFVNVARGGLVSESALRAALDSGQVGWAGLDVHAVEPVRPGSGLASHPRVLATPHAGGLTEMMFRRTAAVFADNVLCWAAGETPRWVVNSPAVLR
jgi:phosphoglycerate dehydrogenase-like enzyme